MAAKVEAAAMTEDEAEDMAKEEALVSVEASITISGWNNSTVSSSRREWWGLLLQY